MKKAEKKGSARYLRFRLKEAEALAIVDALVDDLSRRGQIGFMWLEMSPETREDVKEEWAAKMMASINKLARTARFKQG